MSTNGTKDLRKGFVYIENYLNNSIQNKDNFLLLNVGKNKFDKFNNHNIININETFNGSFDKLKLFYSASDILLAPSVLEAFGQVVIEAASCGTPSVGFDNTGLSDTIKHRKTGYLAKYLSQKDFDFGVNWLLHELNKNNQIFNNECIQFVKNNFASNIVSKKYIGIYNRILNERR